MGFSGLPPSSRDREGELILTLGRWKKLIRPENEKTPKGNGTSTYVNAGLPAIRLERIVMGAKLTKYIFKALTGKPPYAMLSLVEADLADDAEAFTSAELLYRTVKEKSPEFPVHITVLKAVGTVGPEGTKYEREA